MNTYYSLPIILTSNNSLFRVTNDLLSVAVATQSLLFKAVAVHHYWGALK